MRQHNGAADLLVGVAAVNAQAHMQLNGLVELGLGGLAAEVQGLVGLVELGAVDQLGAVDVVFTVFHNFILLCGLSDQFPPTNSAGADHSVTVTPMLRQVPAIMLIALSRLAAFRSGILVLAISSS